MYFSCEEEHITPTQSRVYNLATYSQQHFKKYMFGAYMVGSLLLIN